MGTRSRHLRLLTLFTLLSRALTAVLLYISSHLPLFDSSPRVVLPPSAFPSFASSLLRWDSIHFTTIAEHGYVYEHQWAFYPGVPLVLRTLAYLPTAVQPIVHASLASVSVHTLYALTAIHFPRAPSFAFLSALLSLLPLSPATLYFAPYAEPLFTLLSYKGMLACARRQHFRASFYFVLAASLRSNGILLAIYIPWDILVEPFLRSHQLPSPKTLFSAFLHASLPLLPSFLHQLTAYCLFCLPSHSTTSHASDTPEWCDRNLPSIYTHVQQTYWHVGFLTYWTPTQLPNILLALPVLSLLIWWSTRTLLSTLLPQLTALLSLQLTPPKTPTETPSSSPKPSSERRQLAPSLTPHALHALTLALTLLLAAHTQIALRLAPALPATAWAGAALLSAPCPAGVRNGKVCWDPAVAGQRQGVGWKHRAGRAWVAWSVVWGATSVALWGVFLPPA